MPEAPPLYIHKLLDLLLHLLPHYDPNHFLHSWSFQSLLLSFSLKHIFPSLPLIHLPNSTSLLSVFNPFTDLSIPFGQFFYSVSTFSAFSLIAFQTAFFALFLIFSCLLLFSSVQFRHIAMCEFLFLQAASFTSSFHHHVSSLPLVRLFSTHTSSRAFKTPTLKCPHKFGAPTSTNFITFSLNRFLISTFFNKLIFLFSVHAFITTFHIFSYLYPLLLMYVETPQGLPSHFV